MKNKKKTAGIGSLKRPPIPGIAGTGGSAFGTQPVPGNATAAAGTMARAGKKRRGPRLPGRMRG